MTHPGDCACDSCAPASETAAAPPPRLSELRFHASDHPNLVDRMQRALSRQSVPEADPDRPLTRLGTRAATDPTVALLDVWASALHVLGFYQDRAINEAYLGTAEERLSLVELAQTVGYQPGRGVSAEAWLAFEMNDLTGLERATTLVAGAAVQGLPTQPTEPPPVFETLEDAELRPEWSALGVMTRRSPYLAVVRPDANGRGDLWWVWWTDGPEEDASELPRQDVHPVNFVLDDVPETLAGRRVERLRVRDVISTQAKPGDRLLFRSDGEGTSAFASVKVTAVRSIPADDEVELAISQPTRSIFQSLSKVAKMATLGPVAGGASGSAAESVSTLVGHTLSASQGQRMIGGHKPLGAEIRSQLQRLDPHQPPGARGGVFLSIAAFRAFGHDTQDFAVLSHSLGGALEGISDWDASPRTVWEDMKANNRPSLAQGTSTLALDRASVRAATGASVVVEGPYATQLFDVVAHEDRGLRDYFRSGDTTLLALGKAAGTSPVADFSFRDAVIRVYSDALRPAPFVVDAPVQGTLLHLAGFHPEITVGQPVLVRGELAAAAPPSNAPHLRAAENAAVARATPELRFVATLEHQAGRTVLTLDRPLDQAYRRDSVVINANVVRAIHGESAQQVLGDGDARSTHQRFTLRGGPLSQRAVPSGAEPLLEVYVDEERWEECDTLFDQAPDARRYTLRETGSGELEICFGDGLRGARLPTGRGNVVARWRRGVGPAGNAPARSLLTLRQQPFGVRAVYNPFGARGGVAPEGADALRASAPRWTRVLGRVVSVADVRDFAARYPGVSHADAVQVAWRGGPLVLVTVAAPGADPAEFARRLERGLREAGPPGLRVAVRPHRPAWFRLEVRLEVDPRFRSADVVARAEARLTDHFAPGRRALGQAVTRSEVLQLVSRDEAVRGAFLPVFERDTGTPADLTRDWIVAARAGARDGELDAAELLLPEPPSGLRVSAEKTA